MYARLGLMMDWHLSVNFEKIYDRTLHMPFKWNGSCLLRLAGDLWICS